MPLDAEEARARLSAIEDADWRDKASQRVDALPRRLRPVAAAMLEKEPMPFPVPVAFLARVREAGEQLDAMSGGDRVAVMKAIHPGVGAVLAQWWIDAQSQPYTTGWTRMAFRVQDHPEVTREGRTRSLRSTVQAVGPYADRDIAWVAAWAPFLGFDYGWSSFSRFAIGDACGLLATAVDMGGEAGDAVFGILVEVGNGEHGIGVMGRHVISGLLRSHREDGWDYVTRLLRAAQRQEGLRQAILESADEAAPGAFDRLIHTVLDEDLLRFAAAVRAAGVWIGTGFDVEQTTELRRCLELLRDARGDSALRTAAIEAGDPNATYVALCAAAMTDAFDAADAAAGVVRTRDAAARGSAVRFLSRVSLPAARRVLIEAVDDEDLAVAWLAYEGAALGRYSTDESDPLNALLYEALLRLLFRVPETEVMVEVPGVATHKVEISRSRVVSTLFDLRADRPLSEFVPFVRLMHAMTREAFARVAESQPSLTDDVRDVLLDMAGDRSQGVRARALEALRKARLAPDDAPRLERLLTRKAGDLRRGVLTLLAGLPPSEVLASVHRLWTGTAPQRDGACELLGMVGGRSDEARDLAVSFAETANEHQVELLEKVLGVAPVADRLGPGLGLYDPARRTPSVRPEAPRRAAPFSSDVGRRIVGELDDLAESQRDTPFLLTTWQGSREVLLADARSLPSPFGGGPRPSVDDEGSGGMVLPHVFRTWWDARPGDLREDGLESLRALGALLASQGASLRLPFDRRDELDWWWDALEQLPGPGTLGEVRHGAVVAHVLLWLVADSASAAMVDECLDAVAATSAGVPQAALDALVVEDQRMQWQLAWRRLFTTHPWFLVAAGLFGTQPTLFSRPQLSRWFSFLRWLDEPVTRAPRHRVALTVVLHAHDETIATDDDVYDLLFDVQGRTLSGMTRHRRAALVERHPKAIALVDRLRDRIVEVELGRGDMATPASPLALLLGSIEGVDTVVTLLSRLGRGVLVRGGTFGNPSRENVYSHLIQVSYPSPSDTAGTLRTAAREAKLPEGRLLELAMYAPQWAALVESALGWDGLADSVWWFHAHTKDDRWAVAEELRETWAALSAERTPLTSDDLVAGAVDVAWFLEAFNRLGSDRWRKLDAVAKLASGGNGHRRAQLFSAAMRGEIDDVTLKSRITTKRHQDSVRALGLIPFPPGAGVTDVMSERYGVLREFERGAAKFGSQRRASEQLAVRIGVENLARTAGYPDPQRFVWAMEAAEAGDLAQGPVARTADDVVVTLSVDDEGTPQLAIARRGKSLTAVPGAYRKRTEFAELQARKTALARQTRRVRASLEAAMVRGDEFVPEDFAGLEAHPVVAPMLGLLTYVDDDGLILRREEGELTGLDGSARHPSSVRLAHPTDLLASGEWSRWQEWQFASERRQPFKQLFRELYVVTDAERATSPGSHRYEGHQVQPRQALALLGTRGWLGDRESGEVAKAFLPEGIVARLTFLSGFLTPSEVELPTIEAVYFTKPHEFLAQPLDAVPARVFSEAMRDLDLVVSVAHAGGVDPEASASTVEMRAALVREMARVMKLDNVRFVDDTHVVIDGVLGEYSLHLGSAVVHRRPGGAVCIIPVNSQRRGRLFLPFADDDPKTAEVVSKVLLLARDSQIRDPTILEQLR